MYKWYRAVVVKQAYSQHRGCQFDSSMYHFQNAIGEEGNGKPSHEFHFPRKNSEPFLWFLLRSKSSMQRSSMYRLIISYLHVQTQTVCC